MPRWRATERVAAGSSGSERMSRRIWGETGILQLLNSRRVIESLSHEPSLALMWLSCDDHMSHLYF